MQSPQSRKPMPLQIALRVTREPYPLPPGAGEKPVAISSNSPRQKCPAIDGPYALSEYSNERKFPPSAKSSMRRKGFAFERPNRSPSAQTATARISNVQSPQSHGCRGASCWGSRTTNSDDTGPASPSPTQMRTSLRKHYHRICRRASASM